MSFCVVLVFDRSREIWGVGGFVKSMSVWWLVVIFSCFLLFTLPSFTETKKGESTITN